MSLSKGDASDPRSLSLSKGDAADSDSRSLSLSKGPHPRILSIAGTDPSGGAGIQADLKSIAANGGYGMAVVTALVAQNTHGVRSVHTPPAEFLRAQLDAVSDDVVIDAVKIGMLGSIDVVETVRSWIAANASSGTALGPIVLDPVMVATSGDRLLRADAEAAVLALLPSVDLVTPNLPELAVLAGEPVAIDWAGAIAQALAVSARNSVVVLVKGGHLEGAESPDALVDASGSLGDGRTVVEVAGSRVQTSNTHGTGCSLSSAMATLVARTGDWEQALRQAKAWLTVSLERADELEVGGGNGPINHFAQLWDAADAMAAGAVTVPVTVLEAAPGSSRPVEPLSAHTAVDADPASVAAASITDAWWVEIEPLRTRIDELPFISALADGTLDRTAFADYLAQDAIYLREYARVLARASQLAPTTEEQAFWAEGASGSIVAEMELHRTWLIEHAESGIHVAPTPVTAAYLSHLLTAAESTDYGLVVAALLPCYWIYQDLGERLVSRSHPEHPFAGWLDTYADPAFAISNQRAIDIAGEAAVRATDAGRERMRQAFLVSSAHEEAFFADPLTR
ncbi:bifunctional hydroxymethylpyrimidine kinase/phosphomethylpyrimidine kinase [Plantibacter sp. YIM 135249]|uniref:bifunctional hydroxymethylpyrimidine kinase/phosphomethylpyrimidine kinase n=1 Tax=Plantibacter sp. YIM 135249 TaxID=3423918 RepID=UPI003D3594BB